MTITVRAAAAAVLALGVVVLCGYGLHYSALVDVLPGLRGMAALTAVALAALGAALLAESLGLRRLVQILAFPSLIIGIGLLAVHAVAGSDVVGPQVAAAVFGFDPTLAGKTSIATAGCLVLLAGAALSRSRPHLADGLAAAALIISGTAAIGYTYGIRDLYAVPVFNTMALHSAIAILALSITSILVRADSGWASVIASHEAGGAATRRQLAFILLPPIAGGLLLQATNAKALGPGAAMAFLVILTVAPLALLILRDGQVLNTLERERREKADELRDRLAEQASKLSLESTERAKAEAAMYRAQRMEAVGQLTGGIAHDFNNLLMAIGGNLQLLQKRLAEDHPARRYADNAAAAAARGTSLTGQLLAFSRTQKLHVRPTEIDPVLLKARELIGSSLGPAIMVDMRLNASECWASADADQLELAVLNLALNARDSMPEGGAVIIDSGVCSLRLKAESDMAQYLSIRVTDTGSGMSPDVAGRAVEPFFTTKERGKGTGLGLAQVYGFVRQCGGDLRIVSEVGAGTTVELLLPCADCPEPGAYALPAIDGRAESGRGQGQLVLVIDDDDSVRAVLVDTLRAAGFSVVEAGSGEEGLRHLESIRPDAAIIDFIMPGMNGAECARRVQVILPDLPIIFVSGYYDTIALDGISGAVVLRKPFDVEGLNRAVSSALH